MSVYIIKQLDDVQALIRHGDRFFPSRPLYPLTRLLLPSILHTVAVTAV